MGGELVIIAGLDALSSTGGAEHYCVSLARMACRLGVRPHVFSVARRSSEHHLSYGTLHRVASPWPADVRYAPLHHRRLTKAVVDLLAYRPATHIVHSTGGWSDAGRAACAVLATLGTTAVPLATAFSTVEHETQAKLRSASVRASVRARARHRIDADFARRVASRRERRGFCGSRLVLVNYESVRRLVEQAYGPQLPEIRRVTYCAPAAFEDPRGYARRGATPPLILSTSRHSGRKGVEVLIEALALLRDEGVPFRACLVGGGALLAIHRRLVRELDLSDRVDVPGRVPDVAPYLGAADVFVLPSLEEGSGSLSVLEAMQAGAAIVATDVDGLPEDITHGRDGLLVPSADAVALRDAIAGLIDDPQRRARLGGAARRTFEQRFTADGATAELGAVYRELGLDVRLP